MGYEATEEAFVHLRFGRVGRLANGTAVRGLDCRIVRILVGRGGNQVEVEIDGFGGEVPWLEAHGAERAVLERDMENQRFNKAVLILFRCRRSTRGGRRRGPRGLLSFSRGPLACVGCHVGGGGGFRGESERRG